MRQKFSHIAGLFFALSSLPLHLCPNDQFDQFDKFDPDYNLNYFIANPNSSILDKIEAIQPYVGLALLAKDLFSKFLGKRRKKSNKTVERDTKKYRGRDSCGRDSYHEHYTAIFPEDTPSEKIDRRIKPFEADPHLETHITIYAPNISENFLSRLSKSIGNDIQHNLHRDIVSVVNKTSEWLQTSQATYNRENISSIIFHSADIALDLKEQHKYQRSRSFIRFCSSVLEIAKKGVTILSKGAFRGISYFSSHCKEFLDCFLFDPLQAIINIIKKLAHYLGESAKDSDFSVLPIFLEKLQEGKFHPSALKEYQKIAKERLSQEISKTTNSIKNGFNKFWNRVRRNPEEAAIEGIAQLTETLLSFGLWDIGAIKATQLTKSIVQGVKTEAAVFLSQTQRARAGKVSPLIAVIEDSGQVCNYVLKEVSNGKSNLHPIKKAVNLLSKDNAFIKGERSVVHAIKRAIEVEKVFVRKTLQNIMQKVETPFIENIKKGVTFKGSPTVQQIQKEIKNGLKKLRWSSKNTRGFQKDAILGHPFPENTMLRIRSDVGRRAHGLKSKWAKKGDLVDHINIEIIQGEKKLINGHIKVDDKFNVIKEWWKKCKKK